MKKLLIVESPAKIKTIAKFLGSDFRIMSTMGHVKDLPTRRLGVTVNGSIELEYEPIEGKEKIIAEICKEGRKADEIYLAPDPDREGEIIAWHIEQELKKVVKDPKKIHRIAFNEITKPAVQQAIREPADVDLKKVAAQQARRVLDRWVGYEVSPVLWNKIAKGLSAGRVQSVSLRLICDREEEIRNFTKEEYWTIEGLFAQAKAKLIAALTHINKKKSVIADKKKADQINANLKKTSFTVESIEDKKRLKNPLAPFMTSTLQQAAYNRLGFSVKKTMMIAQNLYEGLPLEDSKTSVALITYMRTDSLRLSDTAITQARGFIGKQFAKEYLPKTANVYAKSKSKKKGKDTTTQDAHEAVRPINTEFTPEYVKKFVPADAAKLYELVWRRFVASQMTQAQYAQRQVTIQGGVYTFKATGSTLIFDGFLKVYRADEEEKEAKIVIPKELQAKKPIDLEKIDPKQHFTQPPPRYTEASLVKQMVKEGIGRPSTYAAIMNTIRKRDYTELDSKKRFIPTELGMKVTKMLTQNLPKIMDLKFTAHMEEDLDVIARGELERDTLLREFYKTFQADLKAFRGSEKKEAEPTKFDCPTCKKNKLVIRFGKSGPFLGCATFPECTFTSNFERDEETGEIKLVKTAAPKILDEECPKCSKKLRQVVGRHGPFVACSGYPECKYIKQEKAPFACPKCKSDVVKRSWRGGTFWGCTGYPKCRFAVFGDVVNQPCPVCKLPFLVKKSYKSGEKIFCSTKECAYNKPDKA